MEQKNRKYKIVLIAAMDNHRVIGNQGRLPWNISQDLKRFKSLTSGHSVIMGRKTFDSLGGKPLPNRINRVISSSQQRSDFKDTDSTKLTFHKSIEDALFCCHSDPHNQVFIIGGSQIYLQALEMDIVDVVELTLVDGFFPGDSFMPLFENNFDLSKSERHSDNQFQFSFETWNRAR